MKIIIAITAALLTSTMAHAENVFDCHEQGSTLATEIQILDSNELKVTAAGGALYGMLKLKSGSDDGSLTYIGVINHALAHDAYEATYILEARNVAVGEVISAATRSWYYASNAPSKNALCVRTR